MFFRTLTLTTLLTTALAAPSIVPRAAGWTIRSFTRDCSNSKTCTYKFGIDKNDGSTPVACTIVNKGNPATTQAWYGVPCQQTADWVISWGWDYNNDFTVMTVVNAPTQTEAFFGYSHPNAATSYTNVGPNAVQHV